MIDLDLLFDRCLHAMRGCADGGTTNYAKSQEGSSTTGEGTPAPYSPLWADELHYRREWKKARSEEDKRAVIVLVLRAVRASTVGNTSRVDEKPNTKEWRIAIAKDLRGAQTVADWFGVHRKTVYELRRKYGEAA